METRRASIISAAIDLLGTEGVRALTHGRVDRRANLPAGSTSNYFRTRAALFQGVVEAMVTREAPELTRLLSPRTREDLVEGLVELFDLLTGPQWVTTVARLALFVEAGHDPDLRTALAAGRRELEREVAAAFGSLGAADPILATQLLAVCFEGMFLHVLAEHAAIDPPALIRRVVEVSLP